jgi:uncharacterized protein (DUF362 family)
MTDAQKIGRREVLAKGLSLGLIAGGAVIFGRPDFLIAQHKPSGIPDLIAVKNGEPDAMFKKAISFMGGMGQFVRKGQTVVVKPNIGWPRTPEVGANTNPLLVKTIIESCYAAGAKRVYVFDNVVLPTSANARKCYQMSGIEDAAKAARGIVVPIDDLSYREVRIPGGKKLKTADVPSLILDCDVFINAPVLKHHGGTHLSIAMKNLMGIVKNRLEYHLVGLDQCIADFCLCRKPDLNVVDAYRVLMSQGPAGPDNPRRANVQMKKTLLLSRDIVAVDAAAARIFGKEPENIGYIKIAHAQKTGNMNLKDLKIVTFAM